MLVAETRRRSNARVLYGILADSALKQINAQDAVESDRHAYFANLIRLLEMYRYKSLERPAPRAVLDTRSPNVNELRREKAENAAVEAAMANVHQSVYPEFSREQLVQHLKDLFSRITRPNEATVDANELAKATRFLEELIVAFRA